VRDYVHVRDIAQAHVLALQNMNEVKGKAFNLGSGQGYSVKKLFQRLGELLKSQSLLR